MMKRIIYTLIMMALLFTATSYSFASGIADTYGLSPKAIGMGNAMTAHVNDWTSVYYNIAGLGRTVNLGKDASKNEVFLGYLYTSPQTELDIPQRYYTDDNGVLKELDTNADDNLDFGALALGAAVDLNMLYKMPGPISSARFGIALTIADDLAVAKVNDIEPKTHNYLRYGREIQKLDIINGAGFGFFDDTFGVGLGVRTSFGGEGNVLLDGVEVSTSPQSPPGQTMMDMELDASAWVAGFYVDFGKIFSVLKGFDMGVSYRAATKFEIDPFSTASVVEAGGIPLDLRLALFDYYYPEIYSIGFSYRPLSSLMVALDVERQGWSDYEVSSVMKKNYAEILPDLDDIWVIKVGMQFDIDPWTSIYGGYTYLPSFVPDEAISGTVNWLDNDKHMGSIGVRYNVGKHFGFQKAMILSGAYQYQYLAERDVTKTSDTVSTLNPDYSYGGSVHTIMVGVGF